MHLLFMTVKVAGHKSHIDEFTSLCIVLLKSAPVGGEIKHRLFVVGIYLPDKQRIALRVAYFLKFVVDYIVAVKPFCEQGRIQHSVHRHRGLEAHRIVKFIVGADYLVGAVEPEHAPTVKKPLESGHILNSASCGIYGRRSVLHRAHHNSVIVGADYLGTCVSEHPD